MVKYYYLSVAMGWEISLPSRKDFWQAYLKCTLQHCGVTAILGDVRDMLPLRSNLQCLMDSVALHCVGLSFTQPDKLSYIALYRKHNAYRNMVIKQISDFCTFRGPPDPREVVWGEAFSYATEAVAPYNTGSWLTPVAILLRRHFVRRSLLSYFSVLEITKLHTRIGTGDRLAQTVQCLH
jgi:hypothetical protein